MTVERFNSRENIVALAKELGIRGGCYTSGERILK
jgi:hypothetical protein